MEVTYIRAKMKTYIINCVNKSTESGNGKAMTKGREPMLYEAPWFCWSFLKFYNVNLRGP